MILCQQVFYGVAFDLYVGEVAETPVTAPFVPVTLKDISHLNPVRLSVLVVVPCDIPRNRVFIYKTEVQGESVIVVGKSGLCLSNYPKPIARAIKELRSTSCVNFSLLLKASVSVNNATEIISR